MTKEKRNNIIRFSYIGATILIIALIMILNEDFHNVPQVIASMDLIWFAGGLVCLFAYWITDGWLLHDITGYMSPVKMRFGSSFKIGMIGLYYSALTPSSTGGQPAQVLYMKREKINVGTSTCIVLIKFIAYALTCIIYYIVSLCFLNSYYMENYPAFYWLSLVGFIIMSGAVFLVIISITKKNWILRMGNGLIGLLSNKLKLMKNPDGAMESFSKTINDYSEAGSYILSHKLRAVGSLLISMLNIGLLFAITYFIYRAFGLNTETFPMVMMLQALLYSAINYFPLPGGAGMSESGFYIVMAALFPADMVFAAMIIWRIITYYAIIIVGSIIVVFDQIFVINRKKEIHKSEEVEEETETDQKETN